tara:strand:- start:127 stop:324 length:198 start_codon:yes stop_codon:yes gene_type:complete
MSEIKLILKTSDIPEDNEWRILADKIGIEAVLSLSELWSGTKVYVPKPSYFYDFAKKPLKTKPSP